MSITYWTINKGSKPRRWGNVPCFSDLWNKEMPDRVRYMPYEAVSDPDTIKWYVGFMAQVLPNVYSSKILTKDGKSKVVFVLKSKGMHYKRAMMYLTWFRYIHEFPYLINAAFPFRKLPLPEMFEKFLTLNYTNCPNSNHALVDPYGRSRKPVSLEKFRENLEKKAQSVGIFDYFL